MSLSYTHLLVPVADDYRPEPNAVAAFASDMITNGHLPDDVKIKLARVIKGEPRIRRMKNPVTGEVIEMHGPSRTLDRPSVLTDSTQIAESTMDYQEYDVSIGGSGMPANPPFDVGHVNNDGWQLMDTPYHLDVRCRVRANPVRLYMIDSPDDLHRPPDFANHRPKFGEDAKGADSDGLFVHPELGAITIPKAGAGSFWVEFNYGKFIFPHADNGQVNVLADSIIALATTSFGTDFIQACDWG